MYKKDITYKDLNNNDVTETVEINISTRRMMDMDIDDLTSRIKKIQKLIKKSGNKANKKIFTECLHLIDELMRSGYGHTETMTLPNGDTVDRFIPATSKETEGFLQSDGYLKMVAGFFKDTSEFETFLSTAIDKDRQREIVDIMKAE